MRMISDYALEMLKENVEAINCFRAVKEYYNFLNAMSDKIALARITRDIEDFQYFCEMLDRNRMFKHNDCISALESLNRLCACNNLPQFYPTDNMGMIDNRGDVTESVVFYFENLYTGFMN